MKGHVTQHVYIVFSSLLSSCNNISSRPCSKSPRCCLLHRHLLTQDRHPSSREFSHSQIPPHAYSCCIVLVTSLVVSSATRPPLQKCPQSPQVNASLNGMFYG